MNKKYIGFTSLVLASICGIGGVIHSASQNKNSIKDVQAAGQTIADEFPSCSNWYNSGKGFALDFTFDIPSTTKQNKFSLYNSSWTRLTRYANLIFDDKGNVSVSGNVNSGMYVIRHADYWTFVCMFDQFQVLSGDGTDTVTILQMEGESQVPLNVLRCIQIDNNMHINEESFIKDDFYEDVHGLMFKAFMPTINSSSKYGMAIVPNEYLSDNTSDYLEDLDNNSVGYAMSYCIPTQLTSSDPLYKKYGAGYTIQASLKVKSENYMRDFSAIAFEEIAGVKKYAFNINEEKANLYNTAYKAVKKDSLSSRAKTYANGIVNDINTRTSALSTSNIIAYPANNIDQIKKDANYTSSETSVLLKAAKGEYEGAQLVLKITSQTDKKFYAAATHLYNGNNVIENSNIEIDYELYQNVATNWSNTAEHAGYLDQLYPNGYDSLSTGYFPDALMPMNVAVRSNSNIISPTHGSNQALYIKVKVPGNVASGTYTGKIIIYVVSEGLITVPVSLVVKNFSIEGRNNANTILNFSRSELEGLYGTRAAYNNLQGKFFNSGLDFLKERGVSGGVVPASCEKLSYLTSYVEAVKKYVTNSRTKSYLINFNQETVSMTYKYNNNVKSIAYNEEVIASDANGERCGLKDILLALVNGSTNELDLLKGCCVYDPHADEPSKPADYLRNILNYNSVRTSIEYVKANADFTGKSNVLNSLDKVTYIVTCGPENGNFVGSSGIHKMSSISNVSASAQYCSCSTAAAIQYRNLDAYCPNIMWNCDNTTHSGSGYGWSTLNNIYNGTNTTTRLWEYNCVQPVAPYPSYIINAPMIRIRANRWRHFSLGIQGEFYYMVNRTSLHSSSDTQLTEQQILDGGATFENAYGDGLFMYPVHDTYGYADKNLYWFSSLRLENISEATDDLNYMYYAKELLGGSVNSNLSSVVDSVYSNKYQPYSMTTNSSTLVAARNNLISLIEGLLS